jgi:hypothetical protein
MNTVTKSSIKSLASVNSELVNFKQLDWQFLEKLFHTGHDQSISRDLERDLLELLEISQKINRTKTLAKKLDLFVSQYRILFKQIRLKYDGILSEFSLQDLKAYEKQMDGVYQLLIIHGLILSSLESSRSELEKYQILYTGLIQLSSWVDNYSIYFSNESIEQVESIAQAILVDQDLQPKPEIENDQPEAQSYLLALSNTAHSILHKLEDSDQRQRKLYGELTEESVFLKEIQIKNNQKLMIWLSQKLNQS